MKKVFILDGGAGRVVTSIPAFLKYQKKHSSEDWKILVAGWDMMFWNIPELQDRVFNSEAKGVFENYIKDADVVVSPEPYRLPSYFRQEKSLAQAFDEIINETDDHSDLEPVKLIVSEKEKLYAKNWCDGLRQQTGNKKIVVIQPFGQGAGMPFVPQNNQIVDFERRSLDPNDYLKIVKILSQKYNLIFFGQPQMTLQEDTYTQKLQSDLRTWTATIQQSDYLIGVDSLGQHIARAVGTPGSVIFGSTFPINTSYPDYFFIFDKDKNNRKYSPIRINMFDSDMANRMNEKCMRFTDTEIKKMCEAIDQDIQKKTKG